MTVTNEMSPVRQCDVSHCAYNLSKNCHAKAITIGHGQIPGCDTFFQSATDHNKEKKRIAGVGACKVHSCKFNDDFECGAAKVTVGMADDKVKCLTFAER